MKFLITTTLLLNTMFSFSQSKKEQIEILQNQLDSIKIEMSKMKQRDDSITLKINTFEFQLEKLSQRLNTSIKNINDSISKEITKIKMNQFLNSQIIDSILKPKVSMIIDKRFEGTWEAYSKGYWGTGTFHIFNGKITFDNSGEVNYELIDFNGEEYLIKLNKDVDNSNQYIMKLGVIYNDGEVFMEIAFYEKEIDGRKGMLKTKGEGGNYGSWGLYTKK